MRTEDNRSATHHSRSILMPQPLALTLKISPSLSRIIVTLFAAIITLLMALLIQGPLKTLEERLGNLGWTLSPDIELEERLTIVAIDEKSLAQIGPWPWPRDVLAELSTALKSAGASVQLYDIVLPEAKLGDDQLLTALKNTNSVLAQVPLLQSEQALQTGVMTHNLTGMHCQPPIPSTPNYLASHQAFSAVPKGHITPTVDSDGTVRMVPPLICVEGQVYPTLALRALLSAAHTQNSAAFIQTDPNLLAPDWTLRFAEYPGLAIPMNDKGDMRISYQKSPASFQVISAADVLNGRIDPTMLQNVWVLVGATAFGLGDIVPTPHSGVTPGVELQARLISSILNNEVPYTPRHASAFLLVLGLGFGAILILLSSIQGRTTTFGLPIAAAALPTAAWALHLQLLSANIWLGWLTPALFAISAAALLSLLEHSRVRMERIRVYNNLNSYLPGNVAGEIAFNLPSGAIEAERRELTLLCADLRNFSAFEESRPPEESAALLHCFFVQATAVIEQHGGSIQEFKGDSVLAAWNVHDHTVTAENALKAAKQLQTMIPSILPSNPPPGLQPMALGVGIEQGPALVGSIGPAHRRTHTLLGDTVTITLRIQEMTEEVAQPILIGECAARHLTGLEIQSQGAFLLNGLRTPHTLFAPIADSFSNEQVQEDDTQPLKVLRGGRLS